MSMARQVPWTLSALIFAWAVPAAADVLPDPERPRYDEHPAPMPDPPPDGHAARLVLCVLTAGLAGGALVLSQRPRRARRLP
jgi:hypothetical protein